MAKIIDNFILIEPLGQGKSSETLKGRNLLTKNSVAVKTIKLEHFLSNPTLRDSIINEIQILKKLENPHVIQMIKMLKSSNNIYLVYEFLNGSPIAKLYQTKKPEKEEVWRLLSQMIEILKLLAKKEYIHGNINPDCLFFNDEILKLKNFLTARTYNSKKTIEIEDYRFTAPETIETGLINPKSDIYSMGMILLEILGFSPFSQDDNKETIQMKSKSFDEKCDLPNDQLYNLIIEMTRYREFDRIDIETLSTKYGEIQESKNDKKNPMHKKIEKLLFKERCKIQFIFNNITTIVNMNNWEYDFPRSNMIIILLKSGIFILSALKNLLLELPNNENLLFSPNFLEAKKISADDFKEWKVNSELFNYFLSIFTSETNELTKLIEKYKKEENLHFEIIEFNVKDLCKKVLEFCEMVLENLKKEKHDEEEREKAVLANYLMDLIFFKECFDNFVKNDCRLSEQKYFKNIETVGIEKLCVMLDKKMNYAKKQCVL